MPLFVWVGLGILATGLATLLLAGGDGSILGLATGQFGALIAMLSLLVVIGSGFFFGQRQKMRPRLWHLAAWITIALIAGLAYPYRGFLGID